MTQATKLTLGTLDVTTVARLVVTRTNRAIRFMKKRADIEHFFRNHSGVEVSEYPGGWATEVRGSDFLSLQIIAKEQ